jgi:hypothetical protein
MARRALRSFREGELKAIESFAILIEDAPRGSAGRLRSAGLLGAEGTSPPRACKPVNLGAKEMLSRHAHGSIESVLSFTH